MQSYSEAPSRFVLPALIKKQAQALYAQQMWNWGQDVRYPAGNLLRTYGFIRTRNVPARQGGSSEYLLLHQGHALRLWSFGLTLTAEQSVEQSAEQTLVLIRHAFRPRWLSEPLAEDVWKISQLPKTRPAGGVAEVWQLKQMTGQVCLIMSA